MSAAKVKKRFRQSAAMTTALGIKTTPTQKNLIPVRASIARVGGLRDQLWRQRVHHKWVLNFICLTTKFSQMTEPRINTSLGWKNARALLKFKTH
jgi:hypothetical protein